MRGNTSNLQRIITNGCLLLVCAALAFQAFARNNFTHRFVRMAGNATSVESVAKMKGIMDRAAKVGYNGIFYDDSKIRIMQGVKLGQGTLDRMRSLAVHAKSKGLDFVPMCFGQTTPAATVGMLENSEAFPVKGTPFLVTGNTAKAISNISIKNGGFAGSSGWGLQGGMKISGGAATCANAGQYPIASQGLTLKKNRAYAITCRIKTANFQFKNEVNISVYCRSKRFYLLNRVYGNLASMETMWQDKILATQDWRTYTIDFNSMNETSVELWVMGSRHPSKGQVWFDDISIREVGLFEAVIRSTTPVVVKSENGSVTYKEGKDYVVGKGMLTIPSGSAIKSGDKLSVDWFQRGDMIGPEPAASFCHNEAWEILWEHAKKLQNTFQSKDGYFVKYSEWRNAFWDPACKKQYADVREYMAGTQIKTNDMLRVIGKNCNAPMYLWQDNFDPYHNSSSKQYYQVNGIQYGNWDLLDPKTILVNWNVHGRLGSMLFFAGKGPAKPKADGKPGPFIKKPIRQILNINEGNTSLQSGWLAKMDSAEAKGMPDGSVVGISYCTWGSNYYGNIEPFANAAKKTGRWLTGPIPRDPVSNACDSTIVIDTTWSSTRYQGLSAARRMGIRVIQSPGSVSPRIEYSVPVNGHARVQLLDAQGRVVRRLVDQHRTAGSHDAQIDASRLPAGVFLLSLFLDGTQQRITRKIVLM